MDKTEAMHIENLNRRLADAQNTICDLMRVYGDVVSELQAEIELLRADAAKSAVEEALGVE